MAGKVEVYVPDGSCGLGEAVTHIGVGAHADDLEFMALEGILHCYHGGGAFAGVTCTDGRGSARSGPYAGTSDDGMVRLRAAEQNRAAELGRYAAMVQLGFSSAEIRSPAGRKPLVAELSQLFASCHPEVVYTHNLADKHPSHIAVALAVIDSLRELPPEVRPRRVLGCEMWRGLDWLGDGEKMVMDVGADPALAAELAAVFKTQIGGGKRYDLAVAGRRRANATFLDPNATDAADGVWYAMDLLPLVKDPGLDTASYTLGFIDRFREDVAEGIGALTRRARP